MCGGNRILPAFVTMTFTGLMLDYGVLIFFNGLFFFPVYTLLYSLTTISILCPKTQVWPTAKTNPMIKYFIIWANVTVFGMIVFIWFTLEFYCRKNCSKPESRSWIEDFMLTRTFSCYKFYYTGILDLVPNNCKGY